MKFINDEVINTNNINSNEYQRCLVLAEIENQINRHYELEKVLNSIVDATSKYLPATGGSSICLWNAKDEEYYISAANVPGEDRNVTAQRVRKKGGATRWIIDNCRPFIMPDIKKDPFIANTLLSETGLNAYAGVPLLHEGKAIGVLYALDKKPRDYSKEDIDFLNELANRAAVAILKVQVYEELRKTNQMLAEKTQMLEQANRELKDFAHVISHDLKSPLYAVSTVVQWLIKDHSEKLDEDGKSLVKLIEKRMYQMKNLIEGILRYSSIGQISTDFEEINLNKLIHEVIDMLNCPENIQIIVQENLPKLFFEKIRIHQIFQNLISNAINAIDKDCGKITISYMDKGNNHLFKITDNGVGIEPGHFKSIFKMFFKNPLAKNKEKSTGIGLSVVKKIIDLYKGEIWFESERNVGTTFYFTLPKTTFVCDNLNDEEEIK